MTRHKRIDLNSEELHFHPFMVGIDKCKGTCITLDDKGTRDLYTSVLKEAQNKHYTYYTRS